MEGRYNKMGSSDARQVIWAPGKFFFFYSFVFFWYQLIFIVYIYCKLQTTWWCKAVTTKQAQTMPALCEFRVWHGSHHRWLLVILHPSPVTPHPWQVTYTQVQVETVGSVWTPWFQCTMVIYHGLQYRKANK